MWSDKVFDWKFLELISILHSERKQLQICLKLIAKHVLFFSDLFEGLQAELYNPHFWQVLA